MTKFTPLISIAPLAAGIVLLGPSADPGDVDRSDVVPTTGVVVGAPAASDAATIAAEAIVPVTTLAPDPLAEADPLTRADPVFDSETSPDATPERVVETMLAPDPLGPVTSPDVGDHCASSFDAADLTDFFSQPIGDFQGADYQRAFRLPDDRVLWTFQDAFISGILVHNVGIIQSGRCFTLLNTGARSWLLGELTSHMQQWQWILDGGVNADMTKFHLFVVQMNETGGSYLSRTRPTTLRRVVLDASSLDVLDVIDEPDRDGELYGWSVTSDAEHTYLYSHCYQQFGYDTILGFGECVADIKLARVPRGEFGAEREYWNGTGWTLDELAADPVVDPYFVGSGNNPAQIRFDGTRFVLVQKRDDWWGRTVDFGAADYPQGPFVHVGSIDEPLNCDRSVCNTYFASWIPWTDSSGDPIWSIGHNRWNGAETHRHLADYRPTFLTMSL
jgi:hypothetical protein